MTYSEAVKSGFRLINSRWQLVAVQAGTMLFNCIAFFILVGIPLGIAFIIFGLDLTGLAQLKDILGLVKSPAELLSKYFGLVLIVLISFLLYIILITTIGLYVFSGSIGTIGRSLIETPSKFSLRSFSTEAKKLFFPLMWYSLVVGLVFLCIAFVLGILGGGVAVAVSSAKSYDSTLALFLGIFFSLVLVLIGLSIILVALAATVYGTAALFFKGEGPLRSFNGALKFLWSRPNAFWLYVILFAGYVTTSFIVMLIVYPFNLIPIIGPIISFPFQILSYVVQGYLGLVIISVVFTYYFNGEIKKTEGPAATEHVPGVTADSSIEREDTSVPEAPGQKTAPPETEEKEQN
jgi:hypothetical protein